MSNQTITLETKTFLDLLEKISLQQKVLNELYQKILLSLPEGLFKKGSNLWWEKAIALGEKEIAQGNYKTYKSTSKFIADLHKGI